MLAGLWVPVLKTICPSHLCSKVQPYGQVLANGMEMEMVCTTLEIILKGRRHDFFFPFFSPFWWLMWANNWGFNRQCLVPLRDSREENWRTPSSWQIRTNPGCWPLEFLHEVMKCSGLSHHIWVFCHKTLNSVPTNTRRKVNHFLLWLGLCTM